MGERPTLVMASANPDKVAEIAALLEEVAEILPRPEAVPDVVEDADTLLGNARLKAIAIVQATGMAAVADDTGLEIDFLDGRPGVYTARFAGVHATYADNVAKALAELDGVAWEQRTARFRTVIVVGYPDGSELVTEGVAEGHIALAETGESGFGYDPIFVPVESGGKTFAEMSPTDKHAISHRGRALHALKAKLK